jgi:predicted dehydrogenase
MLSNRRSFTKSSLLAGAALASGALTSFGGDSPAKRIRAGVIGCGSVSHAYLPVLTGSAFFYEKLGGSMPDLGVYNLTTLTGLLGPVKHVAAMVSIVTPERTVDDKGRIEVTEEDNAMVLMDHGNGVISHVQSGFNYFNPHGHDGSEETRYTITVVGSHGFLGMVGYDWAPLGVDLATKDLPNIRRHAKDPMGYIWQRGAVLAAESLVTGKEMLATPEHALHVLEIMTAARESSRTGKRIPLASTFKWPVVA